MSDCFARGVPDQPIERDGEGVIRFVPNRIVEHLLDFASAHKLDLNILAGMVHRGLFTKDEMAHFLQLTGYSVSGWGDLSWVEEDHANRLDRLAACFPDTRDSAKAMRP